MKKIIAILLIAMFCLTFTATAGDWWWAYQARYYNSDYSAPQDNDPNVGWGTRDGVITQWDKQVENWLCFGTGFQGYKSDMLNVDGWIEMGFGLFPGYLGAMLYDWNEFEAVGNFQIAGIYTVSLRSWVEWDVMVVGPNTGATNSMPYYDYAQGLGTDLGIWGAMPVMGLENKIAAVKGFLDVFVNFYYMLDYAQNKNYSQWESGSLQVTARPEIILSSPNINMKWKIDHGTSIHADHRLQPTTDFGLGYVARAAMDLVMNTTNWKDNDPTYADANPYDTTAGTGGDGLMSKIVTKGYLGVVYQLPIPVEGLSLKVFADVLLDVNHPYSYGWEQNTIIKTESYGALELSYNALFASVGMFIKTQDTYNSSVPYDGSNTFLDYYGSWSDTDGDGNSGWLAKRSPGRGQIGPVLQLGFEAGIWSFLIKYTGETQFRDYDYYKDNFVTVRGSKGESDSYGTAINNYYYTWKNSVMFQFKCVWM